MDIHRSALVPFSPLQMFTLVRDVPRYPEFLRWCHDATVHEQDEGQQLATLEVSLGGIVQSFTTRNRLHSPEKITLSLVEGPFQALGGEWLFQAIGDEGCKVSLSLGFEFSNGLLAGAFRRGFAHLADHLLLDFVERAEDLHGDAED